MRYHIYKCIIIFENTKKKFSYICDHIFINGIMYSLSLIVNIQFSIEKKDILVCVNGKMTLGSFEYDHEGVLELFWTLPLSTTISMVILGLL